METRSRRRRGIPVQSLAVVLVLALLAPGLMAKERRGNDVILTKADGKVVAGELLAVKGTDLLILEASTASGLTVDLAAVRTVRVVKTSKILQGMGAGFLFGGLVGAGIGAAGYSGSNSGDFFDSRGQAALAFGIAFGVFGVVIGGVGGAIAGADKSILVNQASPNGIVTAAGQIRQYARDRG